jgi:hypothetical protein
VKVSINAKNINTLVNADTAHVNSGEGGAAPPPAGAAPAGPAPALPADMPLPPDSLWALLADRLPAFAGDIRELLQLLPVGQGSALNKMRYITEKALHTLCVRKEVSWGQTEPTLERMIGPLLSSGVVPKSVGLHVRTVQTNASPGSHYQESALSDSHVRIALSALAEFLVWFKDQG